MGATEYELLPDSIVARVKVADVERRGKLKEFMDAKARELGRKPKPKEIVDDHRYEMAKRKDEKNQWELDRWERRWMQLQTLGEWVLEQVATFYDRYKRHPSARDTALGCPSQVTPEEVKIVLWHLEEIGLLEGHKVKPARGPSTVRYQLSDDGASLMYGDEEDDADGAVETEPDGAAEPGVDAGEALPEGSAGETERRGRADGEAAQDREGGFARTAKPSAVAQQRASAQAGGEDGGEAHPHDHATGVDA